MRSTLVRAAPAIVFMAVVAACSSAPAPAPAPAPASPSAVVPAPAAAVPAIGTPAATTADPTTTVPTTTTAAPAPTTTNDRPAVEKVFADYNKALLARDFTTACSLTAPQATDALVKALSAQGAQVSTCEQAFAAVYAVPEASGPLDQAARSSTISDVAVAGDIATVTYSGEANGQRREGLTNKMQRTDGQWRLLGNDA